MNSFQSSRFRLCAVVAASALCFVAFSQRVDAQASNKRELKKPSAAELRKARTHNKKGRAYAEAGDFRSAIGEFTLGWKLAPVPGLALNLAQAHRNIEDLAGAIKWYEVFLRLNPDHERGFEAARVLVTLKADLAKQNKAKERALAEARRKQQERERVRRRADARTARVGRGLRLAGLGLAGLGLVSVAVGLKFGLDARSHADKISNQKDRWTLDAIDSFSKGDSAEKKMKIFTSVGGALVAAGGVMYVLGYRARSEARRRQPTIVPTVSDEHAGVVILGDF